MNDIKTRYAYNKKKLHSTKSLIDHYTHKHNKTLVVRCDIRYPTDYDKSTDNNSDITRCMRKVRQKYHRQGLEPMFIWCREKDTSIHPHYHVALLLNGNKVRSYNHVFKTVEDMFKNTIGVDNNGLVDACMRYENGILLDRNRQDYIQKYQDVYRQLSYLAKENGKGEYADGLRDFGMSRLINNRITD